MWICARCHAENKDSAPACVHCGAARAAGRFGSGAAEQATARAPRVTRAPEAVPSRRRAPEGYQPPETQMRPHPPKRPFALLGRIIGGALLVLLPLLAALLAWRQHDALSSALLPLLLDAGTSAPVESLVYIAMALIAVLLAALPGLWTLLLSGRPPKRPRE